MLGWTGDFSGSCEESRIRSQDEFVHHGGDEFRAVSLMGEGRERRGAKAANQTEGK